MSDIQRARIVGAMLEVMADRAAAGVTVTDVVERAGVSRRTFYELFVDRHDCFLAAFEHALADARAHVLPAFGVDGTWLEKVRAAVSALLGFLDNEPTAGRALIVESAGGDAAVLERRGELVAKLVQVISDGAREASATPPPLVCEGVVRGALAVIESRLLESDGEPLVELAKPLTSMIVLPVLGQAAARREIERPAPRQVNVCSERLHADPLRGTGLRLTYRTLRVLVAVADRPGASNRPIAETAEIKDQGQISKLLARLQRAGMIANGGPASGKGFPNSWTLTARGEQMVATVKAHSDEGWLAGRER